jgi:hypothetical protein
MTATTKNTAFDCQLAVGSTINALRKKLFTRLAAWVPGGFARVRDVAPYAAIELLLPGGSLLALMLWLYRRQKARKLRLVRAYTSVGTAIVAPAAAFDGRMAA